MPLLGSSCIFPVPGLQKTAKFYEEKLGFRAAPYLECGEPHICLYRDACEIILLQAKTAMVFLVRTLYGYGYDAYIYAKELEALEQEFFARGIRIIRPVSTTEYRNRELVIEDEDGRWLAFGIKMETGAS